MAIGNEMANSHSKSGSRLFANLAVWVAPEDPFFMAMTNAISAKAEYINCNYVEAKIKAAKAQQCIDNTPSIQSFPEIMRLEMI